MKGTYINTVIMMAALAGKRSKRIVAQKEALMSLDHHKIIWRKTMDKEAITVAKKETPIIY